MKADVHTIDAKKAGSVELADHIFGLEPRVDIIHRVIQWQLNKRQQGTHQAKSRGEINRTTKKFGNQKGGGGARHGSRKAGIFVGGGKAFGPRFRSHETSLNKKVRALGLRHALSTKAKASEIIIIDKAEVKEAKTKLI
ncbi:MAG: 50S ribosomal protein L4, partial [Aestuariivirga sp.]